MKKIILSLILSGVCSVAFSAEDSLKDLKDSDQQTTVSCDCDATVAKDSDPRTKYHDEVVNVEFLDVILDYVPNGGIVTMSTDNVFELKPDVKFLVILEPYIKSETWALINEEALWRSYDANVCPEIFNKPASGNNECEFQCIVHYELDELGFKAIGIPPTIGFIVPAEKDIFFIPKNMPETERNELLHKIDIGRKKANEKLERLEAMGYIKTWDTNIKTRKGVDPWPEMEIWITHDLKTYDPDHNYDDECPWDWSDWVMVPWDWSTVQEGGTMKYRYVTCQIGGRSWIPDATITDPTSQIGVFGVIQDQSETFQCPSFFLPNPLGDTQYPLGDTQSITLSIAEDYISELNKQVRVGKFFRTEEKCSSIQSPEDIEEKKQPIEPKNVFGDRTIFDRGEEEQLSEQQNTEEEQRDPPTVVIRGCDHALTQPTKPQNTKVPAEVLCYIPCKAALDLD